jgi:hypothetical protein
MRFLFESTVAKFLRQPQKLSVSIDIDLIYYAVHQFTEWSLSVLKTKTSVRSMKLTR